MEMDALASHTEESPQLSEDEITKNLHRQDLICGLGKLTPFGIEISVKLAERLENLKKGVAWDTRRARTKEEILTALFEDHPDNKWWKGTFQQKHFCANLGMVIFARHITKMKAIKTPVGTLSRITDKLSTEVMKKKLVEVTPHMWVVSRYAYPDYVWLCDEERETGVLVNAYYTDYLKLRFKSVRFFAEYGSLENNILIGRVTNHGVTDMNVVSMLGCVDRSGLPCPVE
jgi:hypothetical protein